MKNLKKIAALVIVLAMALSTVAFGAVYTDVAEDASYNEAVEVMSALGLLKGYEDGTFGPDKTITRAEFAAVVVRMLGMENAAAGAAVDTIFSDVTAAHWGAGYVQVANQQGIIAGYGDGTFGPDDEVTYEQAVKMIVCALGYEKMFENVPNAYPAGYISQANVLGITIGAVGRIGDKATRAVVAKLAYNALDAGIMEQTKFGTEDVWEPDQDKTLLSENLKIAKVETDLTGVYFNKEDSKKIDITEKVAAKRAYYDAATRSAATSITDFSGKYYYAEDIELQKGYSYVTYIDINSYQPDWKIVAMVPIAGKNTTLVLNGKQTFGGSVDDTVDKAYYYENSKEVDMSQKVIQLETTFKAYENKDYSDMTLATFNTNWGNGSYKEILLIDNNNNNKFDYAYATSYTANVVKEIYERTSRIDYEYAGAREYLDPEDENNIFVIKNEAGEEITFADIKVGDVLNVVKSTNSNTTLREITVTNKKIEGTVGEVVKENSSNKAIEVVIGGETYKVDATKVDITTGDAGSFVLDMYGEVICFELSGGNKNFGMVYNAFIDSSNGDDEPKMIIYTSAGEFVTYSFAANVVVNTGNAKKKADLVTAGTPSIINTTNLPIDDEIVMYSVNSSNEITAIYDTTYIATETGSKYALINNETNVEFRASRDQIGSSYIDDNSVIIANADVKGSISAKSSLKVSSKSMFNEDDKYTYDAIRDVDKNIIFAVVYDAKAKVDKTSIPMYVTATGSSVDSEGNAVQTVSGYVDGEYVTIKIDYNTTTLQSRKYYDVVTDPSNPTWKDAYTVDISNKVAKGDVIQYIGEGEVVDAIRVIATYADYKNGDIDKYLTKALNDDANDTTDKVEGYIHMAKVDEIIRGRVVDFSSGAPAAGVDFAGGIALIAQPKTGWVSGTPTDVDRLFAAKYTFADVENEKVAYGKHTEGTCTLCGSTHTAQQAVSANNDDYLLIYKFDDEAKAAVILDTLADFK